MADICAAADIAPRTFHRYFVAKEDVIAEPVRRMAEIVRDDITAAPAAMPDAEVMRSAMLALGRFAVERQEWLAALRAVVARSHHLQASHIAVRPEQEQDIAALLIARHPGEAEGWETRLLVAYSVAAFRVWYDEHHRTQQPDPLARLAKMLTTVTQGLAP